MKILTRISSVCLIALLTGFTPIAFSYPIDGYDETEIKRLEYYRMSNDGEIKGKKLYEGAKLNLDQVMPRLMNKKMPTELPPVNSQVSAKIPGLIPSQASRYSISLLDLSDPENLTYAEHNGGYRDNVGSVGKILVAAAIFSKLKDIYPDDIEKRREVLVKSQVRADAFSVGDHHTVRFFDIEKRTIKNRKMRIGDTGNLYEFLDWMLSPSSNAAAAMVQRELILLSHFGKAYPVSESQIQAFFKNTPKSELGKIFRAAMEKPLDEMGIDTAQLRQGSFFTRAGKNRVPGVTSYGNPRELMKLLYMMETGRLVDEFSSIEMKRLMYLTERRIRYASHPYLNPFAVYFKSGSLYSCRPERGFRCGKYKGNRRNVLASLAIIEAPAVNPRYHYMVVVQSNVLKVNSAVAHQTLARRVHSLVTSLHPELKAEDMKIKPYVHPGSSSSSSSKGLEIPNDLLEKPDAKVLNKSTVKEPLAPAPELIKEKAKETAE